MKFDEEGRENPEALIFRTTLVICLYEGGDRSSSTVEADQNRIQSGIPKDFNGSMELKVVQRKLFRQLRQRKVK